MEGYSIKINGPNEENSDTFNKQDVKRIRNIIAKYKNKTSPLNEQINKITPTSYSRAKPDRRTAAQDLQPPNSGYLHNLDWANGDISFQDI